MDSQAVQQRSGNKKRRVILSNDVGLSQVLYVITKSNVLTTKELGRLLLFVSKRMTASAFREREDVWKCLCFSHWGKDDAEMLMDCTGLSVKKCFRKFTPDKHTTTVPRPLRYSPEDYLVIVSVRDDLKDKPIFCKTIPGQDVPDFFEEGEMYVELDKTLSKCIVEKDEDGDFRGFLISWEATVHMMRLPDQRIIPRVNTVHDDYIYPCPGSEECDVWPDVVERGTPKLDMNTSYGLALVKPYFRDCNRFEMEIDM